MDFLVLSLLNEPEQRKETHGIDYFVKYNPGEGNSRNPDVSQVLTEKFT